MSGHYQPPPSLQDTHPRGQGEGGGGTSSIDIFIEEDFEDVEDTAKDEPAVDEDSLGADADEEDARDLRIRDKPEISADTTQSSSYFPNDIQSSNCLVGGGDSTQTRNRDEEEYYDGGATTSATPVQDGPIGDDGAGGRYQNQLLTLQLRLQENMNEQCSNTAAMITAAHAAAGVGTTSLQPNNASAGAVNPDSVPSDRDAAVGLLVSSPNTSSHDTFHHQLRLPDPPSGEGDAASGGALPPFSIQQHQALSGEAHQQPALTLDAASYTALLERQLISERLYHAASQQQNSLFLQQNGHPGNGMFHTPHQHAAGASGVSPFLMVAPPSHMFSGLNAPGMQSAYILQQQQMQQHMHQQMQQHMVHQQQAMMGLMPPPSTSHKKDADGDNKPLLLPSTGGRKRSQYVIRPGAIIPESEIADKDILLERGAKGNRHKGSKNYRRLINERRPRYQELPEGSRGAKKIVATAVVTTLKKTGARFIHKKSGQYIVMTDREARNKISQALREKRERTMVGGGSSDEEDG